MGMLQEADIGVGISGVEGMQVIRKHKTDLFKFLLKSQVLLLRNSHSVDYLTISGSHVK